MLSDAEALLPTLRDAQRSADLVLIDLERSANQAVLYAAGKSDLVIIPAQLSASDVREARKAVGVVQQAADLVGRDISISVVLTRTPVIEAASGRSLESSVQKGRPPSSTRGARAESSVSDDDVHRSASVRRRSSRAHRSQRGSTR